MKNPPAFICFALLCLLSLAAQARAAEPSPVGYNRDVLPILADNCFACHGPDKNKRQAELRLDVREDAIAAHEGKYPIVPSKPAESELIRRITLDEGDERMPPAETGKKLTPQQIDILRQWIAAGAPWEKHWSFIPPRRPALPQVQRQDWPRDELDLHVLARLEKLGLGPSPEADKTTLIRRLTLDLTGLPPTPDEVAAFLEDASPFAYERVVERLLASPRFGERMAFRWLDAARYADSNGYQTDGERTMWRWRDWVIEAFNANMPFDQFTVEQLAGDLLPNATLEQRIATAFNRNHRGNAEGGIIPEEYAVEYVVDRVETTATVWLGQTLGCTRCHDHKYDPFSQQEFYQLYAFFNSIPEKGRAIKYGNSPPMLASPTRDQQLELARLDEAIQAAEKEVGRLEDQRLAAQSAWEKTLSAGPAIDWNVPRGLAVGVSFEGDFQAQIANKDFAKKDADKCTGQAKGTPAAFADGRAGKSLQLNGQGHVELGHVELDAGAFGFYDKFTLSAWIYCEEKPHGTIVSKMVDVPRGDGYSLQLVDGRLQLNLVKRWLDDSLRVETEAAAIEADRWHHVAATYDGSRVADGVQFYVDGKLQKLNVLLDELNQEFAAKEPLRIGAGGGPASRFHGRIDEVRLYGRVLSADELAWLATAETIGQIAALSPEERTAAQSSKLVACFTEEHAAQAIRDAHRQQRDLRDRRAQFVESFPTTMVMEELPELRPAFLLLRGQYDKPGDKVNRNVPSVLNGFPASAPRSRLGLAQWLVDPQNPLTARVTVNRLWQMLFGVGLVKTTEDFGTQGERPANPELLDHLASEFVRSGWDVKGLLRRIVISSTYRQSSRATPKLIQLDPENRLLARGPRARLSAEAIRDQALFASGLLVEHSGGPSVNPYQPTGLWEEVSGTTYKQDTGEKLYRRSLYTSWKRTIAPPSMLAFDASGREFCVVRETRTNTPLQALALMNEVTYVEAARVMAARVMRSESLPEARLSLAWQLVLGRQPKERELEILLEGLQEHRARFRDDPVAAEALVRVGEHPRDEQLDVAELAAYTTLVGMILNLDEAITKE